MSKKLWGGRFTKKADPLMERFTRSIHYDCRLVTYDILGSLLHVEILKKAKLISVKEAAQLKKGLKSILSSVKNGKFKIDPDAEDIHSVIQNALEARIGKVALKLHTSRSRNDQVVFDMKLYCIDSLYKTLELSSKLIDALNKKAKQYRSLVIPAFTHLQHAQPISVVYYLGAYMEMLKRDNKRILHIMEDMDITFGSGAVAGTNIPARFYNIKGLPFNKSLKAAVNSVDTVSDRDFIVETLNTMAILGMHLSRMAEDLIIWSTKEFDFVELDDAFCTGSSLMPQKKNPDTLEMIRGYAGRLYGNLVGVLVMMKGLPLTYNRDMQLDKEPVFNSFDIIHDSLSLAAGVISSVKFNKEKIKVQVEDEALYATDMAHYLVSKGVAFKSAHTKIGNLVKYAIQNNKKIKDMTDEELKKFSEYLKKKVVKSIIDPLRSVKSKKSVRG